MYVADVDGKDRNLDKGILLWMLVLLGFSSIGVYPRQFDKKAPLADN